jgi:TRAP-type C4-dicarboxylate transport system permease small subunit
MSNANPKLRPCPDCDKMVSRGAAQCPNCGCRLAVLEVTDPALRARKLGLSIIVLSVIFGISIFLYALGTRMSRQASVIGEAREAGRLGYGLDRVEEKERRAGAVFATTCVLACVVLFGGMGIGWRVGIAEKKDPLLRIMIGFVAVLCPVLFLTVLSGAKLELVLGCVCTFCVLLLPALIVFQFIRSFFPKGEK